MAINDVRIREKGDGRYATFQVDDRTTSSASATIKAGEPVKYASDGSPFVILCATGDPEIGTDILAGIAVKESTETSTVDGEVEVFVPGDNTVLECAATTAANVDTAAEVLALEGDAVAFDLTGGVFTIDENEGNDDNVHGLIIVGGDHRTGRLYFTVKNPVMKKGSIL